MASIKLYAKIRRWLFAIGKILFKVIVKLSLTLELNKLFLKNF